MRKRARTWELSFFRQESMTQTRRSLEQKHVSKPAKTCERVWFSHSSGGISRGKSKNMDMIRETGQLFFRKGFWKIPGKFKFPVSYKDFQSLGAHILFEIGNKFRKISAFRFLQRIPTLPSPRPLGCQSTKVIEFSLKTS